MDLADFASSAEAQEAGLTIEVVSPVDNKPTGATIKVAGPDSRRARKARRASALATFEALGEEATPEQFETEFSIQLIARCILSWENMLESGVPMECNIENAVKVVRVLPWLEDAINIEASNRANFTKG